MKNMKGRLVGASLLLATAAVLIYFGTRSRDSEVEPATVSKTNEAGWTIGIYEVAHGDGELKRLGDGVARTTTASGQVLALDVAFNIRNSMGRIVVNGEGTFIGTRSSGRDIWVDITDPVGAGRFTEAMGFASAVTRGSKPVRRVSSGARRFDVFDAPGDALVTPTTSVLSRDETWIDAAGKIQRIVRYRYVVSAGVKWQTIVSIADRDDSTSVRPPTVRRGNAIPAAAALARAGSLPAGAPSDVIKLPSVSPCQWGLQEDRWLLACRLNLKLETLTLPQAPDVRLPQVGNMARQARHLNSDSVQHPEDNRLHATLTDKSTSGVLLARNHSGLFRLAQRQFGSGVYEHWGFDELNDEFFSCNNPIEASIKLWGAVGSIMGSYGAMVAAISGTGAAAVGPFAVGMAGAFVVGACGADYGYTLVHGDPHLTTFDGYSYNLQAIGEFVHVDSALEVQAEIQFFICRIRPLLFVGAAGHAPRIVPYGEVVAVRNGLSKPPQHRLQPIIHAILYRYILPMGDSSAYCLRGVGIND